MSKKLRRTTVGLLGLTLAMSPASAFADQSSFKDVDGHWAQKQLEQWIASGNLKGFDDGTVRPNESVTRAQFAAMINRLFAFTEEASIDFKDLNASSWAYGDIAKAVKAGYLIGSPDHTVHPNDTVTRQEAAVMIARVLKLSPAQAEALASFKDKDDAAAWSKDSLASLVDRHILNGLPGGLLAPKRAMTRAEAVVLIQAALDAKASAAAVTYNQAGVYGSTDPSAPQVIEGDVVIGAAGVTLQNAVVHGDLILAEGIGAGDATIKNVKVSGTTYVRGGGANSVHFVDSVLVKIVVNKADGSVRIVAEGTTQAGSVVVQSSAKLEESGLTGNGFTDVELAKELPADATVNLVGQFEDVNVYSTQISVKLSEGSIDHLATAPGANNNEIEISQEARVVQLVLEAVTKMLGDGTIASVTAKDGAQGSSFTKAPGQLDGLKKDEVILPQAPAGGGYIPPAPSGPNVVANPTEYLTTQDFGYWSDQDAYNVGFKLNLSKLSYENIASIKVALQDAAGNELANRVATGAQIEQLQADDAQYGAGLDGELSAAFIERSAPASNEWWTSTAYDFTAPSKAVVTITDKSNNVYIVSNGTVNPVAEPVPVQDPETFVQAQDFGFWADQNAYNVGFHIDLDKLNYAQIASIKIALQDDQGQELASRTATGAQLLQLQADDQEYGGLDGQLSAAFVERAEAGSNEWWTSTAYDFAAPSQAVITITDKHNKTYTVVNGSLSPGAPEVTVPDAADYVATQDFGFWRDQQAYNVGFKIDLSKLSYDAIASIKVALQDAQGRELATRIATGAQLEKLKADDESYDELDGQLSAAFIERPAAAANEWWTSTAYDLSLPSKAVITIKDKDNKVYTVTNSVLSSAAPEPVLAQNSAEIVTAQDFGYWADQEAYNVGFKLDTTKLPYANIASIEVALLDEQGVTLAKRRAVQDQIAKLQSDDIEYGGEDGQLNAAFVQRSEAASNEWWTSTAYDFSTPAKAVIKIQDKDGNVYVAENAELTATPVLP
ncbi:S-layer homology domain-containing protein [Paenibacillus sp. MWE-103]|uniref:S-layer homology domain-containing protein n=1 Tax=Paenibacillus artemisiicola TaxID=1172618 RepID=A0ABS3WI98_9BACL|nr:S-layer homology domain-containing protein [Paenibacillus artemisiicola]MBO7748051.1 S-layer homology domain-containing protein [Paenibacillus artemisiicola]